MLLGSACDVVCEKKSVQVCTKKCYATISRAYVPEDERS